MWLDPSCFMSAPGTLSLVISLVLSAVWIEQVCLHTATCLNTPLMRLLTLGFRLCFLCVCVLMWYSLNAVNEGGQTSLCVSVWIWVWLKKWNGGFIWNVTPVYYYILSEFKEIIPQWLEQMQIIRFSALCTHSAKLIRSVSTQRNSLHLIMLQNHLFNSLNILRHEKIRARLPIKDNDK